MFGLQCVCVCMHVTVAALCAQARNLVYMVQRRERLKKQLLQLQLEKLELDTSFPPHHPVTVADHTPNTGTLIQDRSYSASELDSSSDLDMDVPPPRQTRYVFTYFW